MNRIRLAAALFALGALLWVVGALAPWSSIGDQDYPGLRGSEPVWPVLIAIALVVVTSGVTGRGLAAAGRWLLLPVAALTLLLTVVIMIDVATSTAADVAQRLDGPPLTRENAWGVWVSLLGAVVATAAGVAAILAPSPRAAIQPVS